jgi:probable addiction module antidote protein
MPIKTTRWDTAETLKTKEEIATYLDAVLEDGDPELLKLALGNVARSKGMTEIAKEAGLRRTSLYRALSPEGNPEFTTVAGVLKALGLRLSIAQEHVGGRRVSIPQQVTSSSSVRSRRPVKRGLTADEPSAMKRRQRK